MYTNGTYNPLAERREIDVQIEINTVPMCYSYTIGDTTFSDVETEEVAVASDSATATISFDTANIRPCGFTVVTENADLLPYAVTINAKKSVTGKITKTAEYTITGSKQECLFREPADKYEVIITGSDTGVNCKIIPGIIRTYGKAHINTVKSSTLLKPGGITIPAGTLDLSLVCAANNINPGDATEFLNTIPKTARVIFRAKANGMTNYNNIWSGVFEKVSYESSEAFANVVAVEATNNRKFSSSQITFKNNKKFSVLFDYKRPLTVRSVTYPETRADYLVRLDTAVGDAVYTIDRDALKDIGLFLRCETYINRDGNCVFRSITEDAETSGITESFTLSKTMKQIPDLRYDDCYGRVGVGKPNGTVRYAENEYEYDGNYSTAERITPFLDFDNRNEWSVDREQITKVYAFDDIGNFNRELGDYVSVQTKSGTSYGYLTRIDYTYTGALSSRIEVSCYK